jgi:WD40 repeat protein
MKLRPRVIFRSRHVVVGVVALILLVVVGTWYSYQQHGPWLPANAAVLNVTFAPNGHVLAAAVAVDGGQIQLWDASKRQLLRAVPGLPAFSWGPNGDELAALHADGTIRIWRAADGHEVSRFPTAKHVTDIAWSPDGSALAIVQDDLLQIVNRVDGRSFQTIQTFILDATPVVWSPDSTIIALGGEGGQIELWRHDGTRVRTFIPPPPVGAPHALAFSPDGQLIAAGANQQIYVWQTQTGELIQTLRGHTEYVSGLAFSPDGRLLASAAGFFLEGNSTDTSVRLWDVQTGQPVAILGSHDSIATSVTFSPDGGTIASGGYDGKIRLWLIQDK